MSACEVCDKFNIQIINYQKNKEIELMNEIKNKLLNDI